MGKKILIIISLICISYFVKTSLLSEKKVVTLTSNEEKIQTIQKISFAKAVDVDYIENNFNANKNPLLDNPKDLSHYSYYGVSNNCGFSQLLYEERNGKVDLQELTDEEVERFNEAIQVCDKWFATLRNLPAEKLKQLEVDVNKKKKLLSKINIYEYKNDTLKLAKTIIFNEDPDIKFIALEYLLKFDFDFQKKVAQEMNVSQINYLTGYGTDFLILYLCHHGYDCSSQSQIMQDTCRRDENSCGMSFPTWLRSGQVSLNLYDDMMRAIIAIDKVLDSDWFLEHQLDS